MTAQPAAISPIDLTDAVAYELLLAEQRLAAASSEVGNAIVGGRTLETVQTRTEAAAEAEGAARLWRLALDTLTTQDPGFAADAVVCLLTSTPLLPSSGPLAIRQFRGMQLAAPGALRLLSRPLSIDS